MTDDRKELAERFASQEETRRRVVNELAEDLPLRGPSHDGIYPRCVWCGGENYALAVLGYSNGEYPCASVNNCGKYVPESYRTNNGK
jgi:hypothetical protein